MHCNMITYCKFMVYIVGEVQGMRLDHIAYTSLDMFEVSSPIEYSPEYVQANCKYI